MFGTILLLTALASASENAERKAKLFFISTSSTTSTVSTSTYCYTAGANAACGRKKRALEYIEDRPVEIENMVIPSPSATKWDEDDILSEELDQNEALVDSGMNDAARKGKFLLYWKTTTLTSTSTSYTVTYSIGTLECTPSGFTLSACGKK